MHRLKLIACLRIKVEGELAKPILRVRLSITVMPLQSDYVKKFMGGDISLFFIIGKDKEIESINFEDITRRKVDEDRVSILCWNSKSQAEDFLHNILHGDQYLKVVLMNKCQLNDLINRTQHLNWKNILLEPFVDTLCRDS